MSSTAHLLDGHALADLFTLAGVHLDDYLEAARRAGLFLLPEAPNHKGSYAELMAVALVGEWASRPRDGKWFDLVKREHRALFPALPNRTRYHRVLVNLERVFADLALGVPRPDLETGLRRGLPSPSWRARGRGSGVLGR